MMVIIVIIVVTEVIVVIEAIVVIEVRVVIVVIVVIVIVIVIVIVSFHAFDSRNLESRVSQIPESLLLFMSKCPSTV